MVAPQTSLSSTRAAGAPLINTVSLPWAIRGGAGCLVQPAVSTVARAAAFPSINTSGEPVSSTPLGGPILSTILVTAELAALMTFPRARVPAVPSARTATVANPPVPTTTAAATANTAALIRAPVMAPASAPRKLACLIGSPARAAAGPGAPCGGATGAVCNAPTRAIRVTMSSPSDMLNLLSDYPAAWKLSITASSASR